MSARPLHSALGIRANDGTPLAGRLAEDVRIVRAMNILVAGYSFSRADGTLVPDDGVELDFTQLVHQNCAAPPGTTRAIVANLASVALGRAKEVAAQREPMPRPKPPTPDEVARQVGVDLAAQENEALAGLRRIREARERHEQLIASGDATGAAEIRP
jgi:hypothetical protein